MEERDRQIIPGAVHNTILVFGDTPMVSYTHGLLILRMTNFSIMRLTVQRKAGRGMWVMDTKGGMESDVSGLGCHIASRTLIPKCSMTDNDLALMIAFCLNFNGKK
eukprot:gene354-1744_t